ncbi:MAG: glycerate kinase [Chloroflexota bacterium]|nr:glycerate kinase [Chloroflexota bacterium]
MSAGVLRVVLAPDSFGGALDSVAVTEAMATGWLRARPDDDVVRAPMSDGGEGTLAALEAALGAHAERRSVPTSDPLGRPVIADWLLLDGGRAAFIEMATASGLARLLPAERTAASVRVASTRGTGDLIRSALDAGVERIMLGLGGSATNDGGAGLLTALGVRLEDADAAELPPGGAALARLARADATHVDPRLALVEMVIASDVTNPLCGPVGATATYGPQKGADADAIAELDAALEVFGRAVEAASGRAVADAPGAGAAGGTAAGLLGFTNARLQPGVDVVAGMIGLAEMLVGADLVITGEARADEQTLAGKAAMGVATLARHAGASVVLLCGALGHGAAVLDGSGLFDVVQPIIDRPQTLEEAMADTERLLANAAERLARSVSIGERT